MFIIVLNILRNTHTKAWRVLSAKQSNLNAYLQESISGIKITQSFARENLNAEIFDGLCIDNKKAWMKAKVIENFIPRLVTILMVITRLVVYIMGGYMVTKGQMGVGMLIAFAAYVSNFWSPITIFANFYNELINCSAYLERIFELLDEPFVVENLPDAKGKSADIPSTTVLFRAAASLLNRRTDAAQVPVSRLGKMLRTTFLPL